MGNKTKDKIEPVTDTKSKVMGIVCRYCNGTGNELVELLGEHKCFFCDGTGVLLPIYADYLKPYMNFDKLRKQDLVELLHRISHLGIYCKYSEEFQDKTDKILKGEL